MQVSQAMAQYALVKGLFFLNSHLHSSCRLGWVSLHLRRKIYSLPLSLYSLYSKRLTFLVVITPQTSLLYDFWEDSTNENSVRRWENKNKR